MEGAIIKEEEGRGGIAFAFLLLQAHVYMTFKTELKLYHQQLEATRITKAIKSEG